MRLDLNLARVEGGRRAAWRALAWAAGAGLVAAASIANGLHHRSVAAATGPAEARLRALEETARRLEAQRAAGIPAETRDALAALPGRVEAYNQILAAAAFSWTGLLMELEAALPPRVGLTAIQPEPSTGTVTLAGAGRTFEDVAAFVRQLEQRAAFRDVMLLRHSEQVRGGSPADRVQEFSVRLLYEAGGMKAPPRST